MNLTAQLPLGVQGVSVPVATLPDVGGGQLDGHEGRADVAGVLAETQFCLLGEQLLPVVRREFYLFGNSLEIWQENDRKSFSVMMMMMMMMMLMINVNS